jgi:hypothetical protein
MDDLEPTTPDPRRPWFEPVSALLMGFATLGSAWCSFQSSEWSGRSSEHAADVASLQRNISLLHLEANQTKSLHMEIFMEIMDAKFADNAELMRFYVERFTDEMKAAYEGWMAQKPLENPQADPHPFVPHLYEPRFANDIAKALNEEAEHAARSRQAGTVSARYLSTTVLLASTLFFAGTSRNFERRAVRQSMLVFAVLLFLYCLGRVLMLPVA